MEMDPEADDSYMALSEPVEAADSDHGMDKWVFGFVLILAGYGLQWFCNPMLLYIKLQWLLLVNRNIQYLLKKYFFVILLSVMKEFNPIAQIYKGRMPDPNLVSM